MFNHTCIMSITVNHDLVKMRMQVQAPMVESPTGQGKQLAFKVILNGPAALFTLQGQQGKVKCPLVISSFWKPYIGRIKYYLYF